MAKFRLSNSKEFQKTLKLFSSLQEKSTSKAGVVNLAVENSQVKVSVSNEALAAVAVLSAEVADHSNPEFTLLPDLLFGAKWADDLTISWQDSNSYLEVQDKFLKSRLKVSSSGGNYPQITLPEDRGLLPVQLFTDVLKYLKMPSCFLKARNPESAVVLFRGKKGESLEILADDGGFSLAKITTAIPSPLDLNEAVPLFALETMFGTVEPGDLQAFFGVKDYSVFFGKNNRLLRVQSSSDSVSDFDEVLGSLKPWLVTGQVAPLMLHARASDICGFIPAKDKSGSTVRCSFDPGQPTKSTLTLVHREVGDASAVIDSVTDLKVPDGQQQHFNLHPQALTGFTALLKDFGLPIKTSFNHEAVYLEASRPNNPVSGQLTVRYLFPTVTS